jgi:hypothetical protein
MADSAADVLIDVLHEWGVEVIFGLPGDGINGIMEALRKRQEEIRFIQVRHEEAAAFMACAYAKFTGRLGVCLACTPQKISMLIVVHTATGSSPYSWCRPPRTALALTRYWRESHGRWISRWHCVVTDMERLDRGSRGDGHDGSDSPIRRGFGAGAAHSVRSRSRGIRAVSFR